MVRVRYQHNYMLCAELRICSQARIWPGVISIGRYVSDQISIKNNCNLLIRYEHI